MKDITDFIYEAANFDPTKVVNAYSANKDVLQYFADETGKDVKDFTIKADGVRYKKILVPGTELYKKFTAQDLLEKVFDVIDLKDRRDAVPSKHRRKGERDWGYDRTGRKYGSINKEDIDARREKSNREIVNGYDPMND